MSSSVAREFFDSIVSDRDPVAKVRSLINPADPLFETDWLDFKGEHPTDPKQREKSNRSCWSEYLSAFANTGGGVLIWGVDARRTKVNGREIDFAGSEVPINDPIALASKLNEWQGQAINPPLSGVEIKPYPFPEKPTEGFVICYVPHGPLRPYQSLQTSDKQYYLRGGASNFVMDRAVLASMFYPRSQAVFQARANLEYKPSYRRGTLADRKGLPVNTVDEIVCRMSLRNTGTATARAVVGRVTWSIPGVKAGFRANGGNCVANGDDACAFDQTAPIHPGFEVQAFSVSWNSDHRVIDQDVQRGRMPGAPLEFIELKTFCENQEPQTISLQFDLRELVNENKLVVEATAGE
jgi:hypothetical protein